MQDNMKTPEHRASLMDKALEPYRLCAFRATNDKEYAFYGKCYMQAVVLYCDGQITSECLEMFNENLKRQGQVVRSKCINELRMLDGDPMERVMKGAAFININKHNTPFPGFSEMTEQQLKKVQAKNALFEERREKSYQRSEEKIIEQEQKEAAKYGGNQPFVPKEEVSVEMWDPNWKKGIVEVVPEGVPNLSLMNQYYDPVIRQNLDEQRREMINSKPLSMAAIAKKWRDKAKKKESERVCNKLRSGVGHDPREDIALKPGKMEVDNDDVIPDDFCLPGFEVSADDAQLAQRLREKNTIKKEAARIKRAIKRAAKKEEQLKANTETDHDQSDAGKDVSEATFQQSSTQLFLRSLY